MSDTRVGGLGGGLGNAERGGGVGGVAEKVEAKAQVWKNKNTRMKRTGKRPERRRR